MKLSIKYFGMLAEAIGKPEEVIEVVNSQISVEELSQVIENKHASLKTMSFKVAVNQSISENNYLIKENDEVALLPPFAGG